ncbi:LPS translocon maturation chaperone LptM [Pleomorphomonas koreensis]|uniref:LPS translocon maturation chaperone LptM n=1 Tax=Pleomorphomonas koreensis TaxID=257440 RepID=UPI00041C0B23|nr:lipoprotein [Pleomorphomonas koreensis]
MMVLRLGMISLMVCLALAGCGRKGSLEAPKSTVEAAPAATADPGAVTPAAKPATPDKPFILDGLI